MTGLLDRIRSNREKAENERLKTQEGERDEFIQIAIREMMGKSKKNDADRLAAVMESLGRDESDYTGLVESLAEVCRTMGVKEFHDESKSELESLRTKVGQRAKAADALRLKLVHAGAGIASLTRNVDQVTTVVARAKKRVPFIFDEEGNPAPALLPLIKAEFDRQAERCKQATKFADDALAIASKLPE